MSIKRTRFYSFILLPSIIIAGAALRFLYIGRESLWFDELFTVWAGGLPLKEMIAQGAASGHPLLYNLLTSLWLSVSSNDVWIRTISFTCGVSTIGVIYLLGKEFASRRAGLWASALAAVSPFLYYYSREATDKSLDILVTSVSLYFFVRSMNRGGWRNWTGYVVATATVLFAHFYGLFVVIGEVIFFITAYDRKHLRLRSWLTSQFILALIVAFWGISNIESARWISFNAPKPLTVLQDVFFHGPIDMMGFILPLNNGDISFPGANKIIYMIVAGALIMLPSLLWFSGDFRRRVLDRKILALVLLILIATAGPVISQLLRNYYTSVRYYAWGVIPFLLLMAILLAAMPRRIGAIVGSIAIIGSFGITAWSLHVYYYDNYRGIMSTINTEQQKGDILLCYPLSECTTAADHYLHDGPNFRGGYINNINSIKFYPPGIVWDGYDTDNKFGLPKLLSGKKLKQRIITDMGNAGRVWVLGGDGSVARIKRAEAVYKILAPQWHVKQQMSFPPYLLRLYVRDN